MVYANATLITHMVTLYFDIASRLPVSTQEELIMPELQRFFARFHSFYEDAEPKTKEIQTAILLQIKKRTIFAMQKFDASLSLYSFKLLSLLKGIGSSPSSLLESSISPSSPNAPYHHHPKLTHRSHLPSPADYKATIAKNRAFSGSW